MLTEQVRVAVLHVASCGNKFLTSIGLGHGIGSFLNVHEGGRFFQIKAKIGDQVDVVSLQALTASASEKAPTRWPLKPV